MREIWLGLQEYGEMQALQKSKVLEYAGQPHIDIYGLEFDETLTLGVRSLKSSSSDLDNINNFKIVETDRGGQATIHSRGQLVVFPMLDLKFYNLGPQKFIQILFESTQVFLGIYGISSHLQLKDAGVYTADGKIAFCGLRIESGVVRHGISININNDVSLFKSFVACGNSNLKADSLSLHLKSGQQNENLQVYFTQWCVCFSQVWEQQYKLKDKGETVIQR